MNRDRDEKDDSEVDFFFEKCLRTFKSTRWINSKFFVKKTLSDEMFVIVLRKFRILSCFQLFA